MLQSKNHDMVVTTLWSTISLAEICERQETQRQFSAFVWWIGVTKAEKHVAVIDLTSYTHI